MTALLVPPSQRTSDGLPVRLGRVALVASAPLLGTAVVLLGAATPGYDPWSETVSRLGSPGERYAVAARAAFVAYGMLVVLGAGPLGRAWARRGRLLTALVATYGAAALVAGLAPKDPAHAAHTPASAVHVAATIVGGAAVLAALALVAATATRSRTRRAAIAVGVTTVVALVVFRCTWGSPTYGLTERIALSLPAWWLTSMALSPRSCGSWRPPVRRDGPAGGRRRWPPPAPRP